ncbi:hypothetical protein MNBD_GAMMA12-1018 [hydrothermal vent metagenome]|uniref:Carboxymuconolactone decarboxylase-like domain-containing protein n=1 Tax=hydrothermal vent metagenome TaxID=652676 RepID=A0A3B0ZNJ8_9ZZZZ
MKEVYTIFNETNAPDGARALLSRVRNQYGFVPNSLAEMAVSPQTLEAYLVLEDLVSRTSLTENERMIVMLTASCANECSYCVPEVSATARGHGLPDEVVSCIRNGTALENEKLEILRCFTEKLIYKKGWETDHDIQDFLTRGYTKRQMLEVVLLVSMKNIAIYCNHIMSPDLDEEFVSERWH